MHRNNREPALVSRRERLSLLFCEPLRRAHIGIRQVYKSERIFYIRLDDRLLARKDSSVREDHRIAADSSQHATLVMDL